MLKNILKLDGAKALNKSEQNSIVGGTDPGKCLACGGFPTPNGMCLGNRETHCCLSGMCR